MEICKLEHVRKDYRMGELVSPLKDVNLTVESGEFITVEGPSGIGKSTLVLQTVLALKDKRILYVSGEESARQIKLRAERLAPDEASAENGGMLVFTETSLEQIFLQIQETQPDLVVIDSIQTISTETVESSPGSLSQIRECAASLLRYAKSGGVSILLIGHITKPELGCMLITRDGGEMELKAQGWQALTDK